MHRAVEPRGGVRSHCEAIRPDVVGLANAIIAKFP